MKKSNVIIGCLIAVILAFSKKLLSFNFIFFIKWYLTLLGTGLIFYPITMKVFGKFSNKGWFFSKVLGFAIPGLTFWLLSYLKLLRYTAVNCYLVVGIFAIFSIWLLVKSKNEERKFSAQLLHSILSSELLFLIIFLFWTYFKCFSYGLDYQTEKYMNYGFLNALYHTEYMPAEDIWLSGYQINYYYFGQYLASFMAKITFSQVNETFNLFVALINTMSFVLPFSICYTLMKHFPNLFPKIKKIWPSLCGLIAAFAVAVGGTLYFPIYRLIVDREALGLGEYYYWEDSRYIGYRPDTNDKTINEILPYSSVIGDMHAHHIDTMLVFTTLALLVGFMLEEDEESNHPFSFYLRFALLGCVLGIQKMTNFWDFPIYLTVIILCIGFQLLAKYHLSKETIKRTLLIYFEVILISILVSLPFTNDLYMSTTTIRLTHVTSPFYKMCVFWGLPTVCILYFLIFLVIRFMKTKEKHHFRSSMWKYFSNLNKSDLFIFIIGCCAIGLIIIPEIIYVKDIYASEYKRANTVYKVWYQAEILFDLSVSYIVMRFLGEKSGIVKKVIPLLFLVMFVSTFGYGINAIDFAASHFSKNTFNSLDNTEFFIKKESMNDYYAIQWIKKNIPKDKIIAQKTNGSYQLTPFVSVLTANPTVLGWHGHEWIWRAVNINLVPEENEKNEKEEQISTCPKEISERFEDMGTLFRSKDEKKLKEIIDKYEISYIYLSDLNSKENPTVNGEALKTLGTIVHKEDEDLKSSPVYIIQVGEY